jgi:hypothetical protein
LASLHATFFLVLLAAWAAIVMTDILRLPGRVFQHWQCHVTKMGHTSAERGEWKVFSFNRDKKRIELQSYMRRVADLTTPNLAPLSGNYRSEGRCNRSLPVLIVPCVGANHREEEAAFAVSKDICDHGLSLLACQPYPLTEVIVGLWLSGPHLDQEEAEPFYVLGHVRQSSEIGGGYWQIGIELTEVVKSRRIASALSPLAQRLLPDDSREETALAT